MKFYLTVFIYIISTFTFHSSSLTKSTKYDFSLERNHRIPLRLYPIRYYLDTRTATCKKFEYKGAGGTSFNNFASLEECNKEFEYDYASRVDVCTATSTSTGDLTEHGNNDFNVCEKTHVTRYYFKRPTASGTGECKAYNYKGCNEPKFSFPSDATCKDMCITTDAPHAIPNKVDCEVGAILTSNTATATEIKIVRDKEKSTCVHAIVDKKEGLRGVFETFSQCQKKCHVDDAAIKRCKSDPYQPTKEGHITTKYYYNFKNQFCMQMLAVDTEVDSTRNYFDTAGECISACPALNDDITEANFRDIPPVCSEPKEPGNGNEASTLPRWYYDNAEKVCKRFAYTGIGGNANNFDSEALCNYVCTEGINEVNLPEPTTTPEPITETPTTASETDSEAESTPLDTEPTTEDTNENTQSAEEGEGEEEEEEEEQSRLTGLDGAAVPNN